MEPKSIFSYYYDAALQSTAGLGMSMQLREMKGARILVLDYCGMTSRCMGMFQDSDVRVFLVDDSSEDMSIIGSQNSTAVYDVVYMLTYEGQMVNTDFKCVNVIFRGNSVSSIVARL